MPITGKLPGKAIAIEDIERRIYSKVGYYSGFITQR